MSECLRSHLCATFLLVCVSMYVANKGKIASLGGIEAIIEAMSTHKDHSVVQEKACAAFWNLAANDGMPARLEACLDVINLHFRPCVFLTINNSLDKRLTTSYMYLVFCRDEIM